MNPCAQDKEETARWLKEMPVLACITRQPPKKDEEYGGFVRTTEWGDLYLKGEHYTLVRS